MQLPDPALVVLVGPSGAGKSTWAADRYRSAEVVSSDDLRAVVGSGRHDLDASADAFLLLDQIVAGRIRRGLTTVVDTLGLDPVRRLAWLGAARAGGMSAVVVCFDTPAALCRQRNRDRDLPIPARVLTEQLRTYRDMHARLAAEGWDALLTVADHDDAGSPDQSADRADVPGAAREPAGPGRRASVPEVMLQVSRFPWGEDPRTWLTEIAVAADAAGFSGLALMDHLIQIPQVDAAWEPIPEPFVVLGLLAGLDTGLRLGTLVTPATFRPPGIIAKTLSTLDVISGGRAFCGIGAGWWEREHLAFGLPFPGRAERLDLLETAIETMRALWAPGTKPYAGDRVDLPETTSYPRPLSAIPIIVGGSGEQRTLRIAARLGDGCNVRSDTETVERKTAVLRRHCAAVGRDPDDVAVTVLDLPVIGRDRDDSWDRVERLRGRTPAAVFAQRHPTGTAADHRARYRALGDMGVRTIFVALADLTRAEDVVDVAAMIPT